MAIALTVPVGAQSVLRHRICGGYGLPYNTGPLHRQFGSVVKKTVRLALPGGRGTEAPARVPETVAAEPRMAVAA